ncbi:MAG: hypothetical protein JSU04_16875 [Bdellovibrionales bacterium]|nr:hypothetical protein [Bdellovibrionales bacterium]
MKAFSALPFILAMTVSFSAFANVRIKVVDKDDKPIPNVIMFGVASGKKLTMGTGGGMPGAGSARRYSFGGLNFVANNQGVISTDPQGDLSKFGGGFFSQRTEFYYSVGIYSFGSSSTSNGGLDGAKCVALTGADAFTPEQKQDLGLGTIRLDWKVSAQVDVLCKFPQKSASEVMTELKERKDLANSNGQEIPVAGQD